jgi:hypothetical protein
MSNFRSHRQSRFLLFCCIPSLLLASQVLAQQSGSLDGRALYDALKKFELRGKASVSQLKLKRDRAEMTFTGDFYFMAPVNGRVTGAVFLGQGTFLAAAPPPQIEKDNLKKFLNAEQVSSDFQQAVLRFSDNTFDIIGKQADKSTAPSPEAQKLAAELEPRLLKEAGVNISSRLLISMLNGESPGVFLAEFDKGQLNRFVFLLDFQTRIPSFVFGLNGGEKVMVIRHAHESYENDIWIASHSEADFQRGKVLFPSSFDLVSPDHYKIEIDLREPQKVLITQIRIDFASSVDKLRAIPMIMNEGITEFDNNRLKQSMKVKSAKLEGKDMPFVQEDWEIGLTLILPKPMNPPIVNEKDEEEGLFSIELQTEGDCIDHTRQNENLYFPQPNVSWYPRYGYLKRSTYVLAFRHKRDDKISSVGRLATEKAWPDNSSERLTEFSVATPITFATFTSGLLERDSDSFPQGTTDVLLDVYRMSGPITPTRGKFILTEIKGALTYFKEKFFGPYIYTNYRATAHPSAGLMQAFPTMVRIPLSLMDELNLKAPKGSSPTWLIQKTEEANRDVYKFIGSQTAAEWWENAVIWRSYRDQWLRDGFTEYAGLLYTKVRSSIASMREQLRAARSAMPDAPTAAAGKGVGKAAEIGPLLFGKRLKTRATMNAEDTISKKGALVLRMLHFLLTDPSNSRNDDKVFIEMLKNFEQLGATRETGADEFKTVAEEFYKDSPISKIVDAQMSTPNDPKSKNQNLDWFFDQWVNQAKLPSYRLEYTVFVQGEGAQQKRTMKGKIFQENAGKDWVMPLPVVVKYFSGREAKFIICAKGPETSIGEVPLPELPIGVELDPDMWILSEKTTAENK